MHRSQSTLDSNKKSLWGTLKSKKKNTDNNHLKRRSSTKAFNRLSISSSSTTNSINNNNIKSSMSGLKSHDSSSPTPSPVTSRPVSMSPSFNYSLDPNAHKDTESLYSSPRNSMYSMRSTDQSHHEKKNNNRFSRIFDTDLFNVDDISTSVTPTTVRSNKATRSKRESMRNPNKRHSVMFGKDTIPEDFLSTLKQVPSNNVLEEDEEELAMTSSPSFKELSLTFEDYKLALEIYGDNGVDSNKTTVEKDKPSPVVPTSTMNSSSVSSSVFGTDIESIGEKMEVKLFSNCIWIGSCQSSIFENNSDDDITSKNLIGVGKLNNIDIKINDDLNGIFEEEDDEDEDYKERKKTVQRTSLYFT